MKQVYLPANAPEAHMLSHLLEQAGIRAHIHGEALQGAAGDLPVTGTLQILVSDDDYERARELVLKWEKTELPTEPADQRRFPTLVAIIFLALGLAGGWVAKTAFEQSRLTIGDRVTEEDRNGDGRTDSTWFYRLGSRHAYKGEFDHNHDGRVDTRTFYDEIGTPVEQDEDNNFDGGFEQKEFFRHGVRIRAEIDTDGDRVADDVQFFLDNGFVREELTDRRTGYVLRINYFENHLLARADIDLDRDGFRETRREFDHFGEIVRTETLRR